MSTVTASADCAAGTAASGAALAACTLQRPSRPPKRCRSSLHSSLDAAVPTFERDMCPFRWGNRAHRGELESSFAFCLVVRGPCPGLGCVSLRFSLLYAVRRRGRGSVGRGVGGVGPRTSPANTAASSSCPFARATRASPKNARASPWPWQTAIHSRAADGSNPCLQVHRGEQLALLALGELGAVEEGGQRLEASKSLAPQQRLEDHAEQRGGRHRQAASSARLPCASSIQAANSSRSAWLTPARALARGCASRRRVSPTGDPAPQLDPAAEPGERVVLGDPRRLGRRLE